MATAQDGGATATATTSSYAGGGGGGAGGKFRKTPFRRHATPYDPPPTGLRGNDNNGNWLTKLVVDPASKLISYGANRFFASLFRKRLPAPPPPPHTPELNHSTSDGLPAADPNNQNCAQEPAGGECNQPINSSSSNGISDLEKMLKQKTFSRSEIDHLTELLRSKAGEVPIRDDGNRSEHTSLDFGRNQQLASGTMEQNRNNGNKSHEIVSTPVFNSKVTKDDLASPAELAKAYMGSKPTKVSPSMLGIRGQVSREENMRFASQSPIMSLTTKTSVAPENVFTTPRSRGRSALYSMPRSPYSRVQPSSNLKFQGSGLVHNGYASSFSPVEHDKQFEAKSMTLKRRSSVLEDEVRSVGPIRRIRQKFNLISPRFPRTADEGGFDSPAVVVSSKQKQATKAVGKSVDNSSPSTSYAHVPSKSSEVAAKILQHLENMTPKEKPSGSRFVAGREKSPFKLTESMLSGQALKSMEDMGSSKLLLDFQDDHKSELKDNSNATLPDLRDSISQDKGKGKVKEIAPRVSFAPSDSLSPVINNDSSASLKPSFVSTEGETSDSVLNSGVSQPPQKKRAFRMSAQEYSFELDDDEQCNGVESRPLPEEKGQHIEIKLSPAEEPKPVKTTILPEMKSPSGLTFSNTNELSNSGAVLDIREESSFPAFEKSTQSSAVPLSVAAFDKPKEASNPPSPFSFGSKVDKPKEANDPPSLFSFGSKVADKFPSLPSESSGKVSESKPESSSSLVDVPGTTGSLMKIPDPEKAAHPKAGDRIEKSDTIPSAASNVPTPAFGLFSSASSDNTNQIPKSNPDTIPSAAASNGPQPAVSTPSFGLFPSAAASNDTNQIPKASHNLFTNIGNSSNGIFGSATTPPALGAPVFNFGAAAPDSSTAVSAASTATNPIAGDSKTKSEINSVSNITSFGNVNFKKSTFGLSSSTANNLQAPLFTTATSGPTFGFSSSVSSSDTTPVVSSSGPTSSAVVFGAISPAVSENSTVASTSAFTPSIFGFGSTTGPTPPVFGSSVSASGSSTSSFTNGTSGSVFNFGADSSSSSSAITSNSSATTTPNVFGASWQNPNLSSNFAASSSSSPSTGFPFGATSSVGPTFPFTASSSALPSPVFGNPSSGLSPSNDQMNAEDSMAEDHPVQSGAPSVPIFGQSSVSPSPPPGGSFMFGSSAAAPSQPNQFQFGSQQNQAAPQNPSPFQGSSSFNAGGGGFSLGSGGDKSNRKFVRVNRNKNRKK